MGIQRDVLPDGIPHADGFVDFQQKPGKDAGVMGKWFWDMFCCSERDHTRNFEAALKAAEIGRPPPAPQQFPRPGHQGARGLSPGAAARHVMPGGRNQLQQHSLQHSQLDSDSESDGGRYSTHRQTRMHRQTRRRPQHSRLDSGSDSDGDPSLCPLQHSRLESDSGSDGSRYSMQRGTCQQQPKTTPPPPKSSIATDLMSGATTDAGDDGSIAASELKRWEWPKWCLTFKEPCIEVYVVDDETGECRWVHAVPQSKVVDKSGRDAYLCVEYEWNGDFFFQDFGPQTVRRRGDDKSVFDILRDKGNDGGGSALIGA